MEIDIPDLQDLRFVDTCSSCKEGVYTNYKKQGRNYVEVDEPCVYCEGRGKNLTIVGKRLLEFLDKIGLTFDPTGWTK